MESQPASHPNAEADEGEHLRCYSLRELAKIAKVTIQRARAWVRAGLIQAVDGTNAFGFHEVRLATVLARLAENGVRTARLRAVQAQLRRRFPDGRDALAQLEFLTGLLVIRDNESRPTAPDGQRLLNLHADNRAELQSTVPLRSVDRATADDLFQRALALEEAGDLEGAARSYRECLLRLGPDPVACFNLANVLSMAGHHEAAIERYRQATELNPAYAAAWNNLGLELAHLGNSHEAIEAWQSAVQADRLQADAVFNLADAWQEAKRFDEARPLWNAYLRLDREGEWHDYARACLNDCPARR